MDRPTYHKLDYAPPPDRTWPATAAKWLRRAIVAVSLVVVATLLFRAAQPRIREMQLQIQYAPARAAAFAKCLTHTYPPETVVFDEIADADGARSVCPRPVAQPVSWSETSFRILFAGWPRPRNLDQLSGAEAMFTLDQQIRGTRLQSGLRWRKSYSCDKIGDEVFVHRIRATGGEPALLIIAFDPVAFMAGHDTPFRSDVVRDGRLFGLQRHICMDANGFRFIIDPSQPLTLYAGQIDPGDESHFTIDYATPQGRGTIDGWLLADDTIKLQVRDGPAK